MAVPLLSEWDTPKKILLMVNNSEDQPEMVKSVFELAELFNATVYVAIFTDVDSAVAVNYLKDKWGVISYEEKLKTKYPNADIKSVHVDGHRFQETIEEYVLEQRIDFVAMITHKRTFLKSIFNRSMTKKMSYHTRIPLLAIPA